MALSTPGNNDTVGAILARAQAAVTATYAPQDPLQLRTKYWRSIGYKPPPPPVTVRVPRSLCSTELPELPRSNLVLHMITSICAANPRVESGMRLAGRAPRFSRAARWP